MPVCDYGSRRSAAPTFAKTPKAEALLNPGIPSGSLGKHAHRLPVRPRTGVHAKAPSSPEHYADTRRSSCEDQMQDAPVTGQQALVALQLDSVVYQRQFTGPFQNILQLPIPPTRQNAMLICKFSELLHPCKGSLDGGTDSDNPFVTQYLPWCVQSPLLALSSLFVSSKAMSDVGIVDQRSTMMAKGAAISKLNDYLRSDDDWGSDEVLATIAQFMSVEFLYGEPQVAQAHVTGFKEIIRLRGAFPSHGVGALVAKFAVVIDRFFAFWLEEVPVMDRPPELEFTFNHLVADRFKVRFNCPLGPSSVTFESCEEVLGIHLATASILDDIRFLINLALETSLSSDPGQDRKLAATAAWILDRIRRLNPQYPGGPEKPVGNCDDGLGWKSTEATKAEVKPHSLLSSHPSYTSVFKSPSPSDSTTDDESFPRSSPDCESPNLLAADRQTHHSKASFSSLDSDNDNKNSQIPHSQRQTRRDRPRAARLEADPLYVSVRLAAILYARAIATRRPLSAVCLPSDALALLSTTWQIPLARWRRVIGVFIFVFTSISPSLKSVEFPQAEGSDNGEQEKYSNSRNRESRRSHSSTTEEEEECCETRSLDGRVPDNGKIIITSSSISGKREQDAKESAAETQLRPHCGFVKAVLQVGWTQMAVEDWSLCDETLRRALALQAWLGRRTT